MEWSDVAEKAMEYFSDNYSDLEYAAQELDRYSDYVRENLYYESGYEPMDYLDEYFYGSKATEILDSIDSDFNTSASYFYTGNGTPFESVDYPDYDYNEINDYDFIERLYDNASRLDLPEYIEKLFEAYDEGEEDEEDDEEDEEDEEI